MSDSRGKTLFIVEGNHEKNTLIYLLCRCFKELSIDMNNVIIYGTNIYNLYDKIIEEYGVDWEDIDVDLAYLYCKIKGITPILRNNQFKDIYLIFDYEHHDTYYSDSKIIKMQNYFSDSSNVGKLYINYPMIEAYQDFEKIEIGNYINKNISTSLKPGSQYKDMVHNRSIIEPIIKIPAKIIKILEDANIKDKFCICDKIIFKTIDSNLRQDIHNELNWFIEEKLAKEYSYSIYAKIIQYAKSGTFVECLRENFIKLIRIIIAKAYCLSNNKLPFDINKSKIDISEDLFNNINHLNILKNQNSSSTNLKIIWVLATCLLLIPDYNYKLIEYLD